MSTSRLRAIALGFLVALSVGSFAASAASAAAGPFWHHRNNAKEAAGTKIEENAQEAVRGKGGEQKLVGTIGGAAVEIVSTEMQVKGQIYNNAEQGQGKFLLHYINPKVSGAPAGCIVNIGQGQNDVPVQAHLVWKWNGTPAQLAETSQKQQKVDGIITPVSIQNGATTLPKAVFTVITLSGNCGVLNGKYEVTENVAFDFNPASIEEWRTSIEISVKGGAQQQHFWNGTSFQGVTTGLMFNKLAAKYVGNSAFEPTGQEIAVFEN